MAFYRQRQSEHLCALERHRHELDCKNCFSCQRLRSSLATKVAKRRLKRQKNPERKKGCTAIPAASCMYTQKLRNGSNQPESLEDIDTYLADVI